jgi:hypothetical protein
MLVLALKGTGKTIDLTQMAFELASGNPHLGIFNVSRKRRVLLLQKEVADKDYQDRLQKVATRYSGIKSGTFFMPKAEDLLPLRLDTPEGLNMLDNMMAWTKPDVVMVDPLYRFHFQDEDKSWLMKPMFDALDGFRIKHRASFVISHHLKKPQNDPRTGKRFIQDMFSSRGTGTIIDWMDTVFTMNEDKNGKILVDTFMRTGAEEHPTLVLTLNRKFVVFEGVVQGMMTGNEDWAIITVLKKHSDEMDYDELIYNLIKHHKLGKRHAGMAIAQMKSKNLIYYVDLKGKRLVRLLSPQTRSWAI